MFMLVSLGEELLEAADCGGFVTIGGKLLETSGEIVPLATSEGLKGPEIFEETRASGMMAELEVLAGTKGWEVLLRMEGLALEEALEEV